MTFRILTSFILVLASALLTIWAAHTDARSRLYLFKPLTTSLIILTALWLPDAVPQPYKVLVVTGLAYSLAGDIFLMLPSDRFIFGLGSFLVAHILYAGAFVGGGGPRLTLWLLLLYLLFGVTMLLLLWPFIAEVRLPVLLYIVVIVIMSWQAAERWYALGGAGTALAAAGALLFLISDSALAFDRFRAPFRVSRHVVLGTYFAAQWLIALSTGVT